MELLYLHKNEMLPWKSQDVAKDLPKIDNLGSKSWGRGFLVGNNLMFKNSLVDVMGTGRGRVLGTSS